MNQRLHTRHGRLRVGLLFIVFSPEKLAGLSVNLLYILALLVISFNRFLEGVEELITVKFIIHIDKVDNNNSANVS